jgi:hypothetical protein
MSTVAEPLSQQSQEPLAPPASPQDTSRAALYEQYYATQPTGETPAPAVAVPTPEAPAQVAQPSESVTPPVAQIPPEFLTVLQGLQEKIAGLEAKLPAPPATPTTPEAESKWISLLREGKIKEAETAMAEHVAALNGPALTQQAIQQAVAQTREVMRAESEAATFVAQLRTENQDLLPMESLIAAEAQRLMNVKQQSGTIKTTDDAIRTYKESVTEAVSSARKLYHRIRGEGNQEAQVRNREVLASRPIPPQSVDTSRPQVTGQQPQAPPEETPQDYMARRLAIQNWQKGLAPKPNFI